MTKKPFRSRSWLELTSRCERAIAWSRSASAAFARPLVASRIAPTRLNHARARLGAIVFLSALGFALFGIVMRAALLAAPADTAPTGGKVLIAGGQGTHGGNFYISSTELYDPATNSFAAAADTAAMNHARSDATATLLPSGKVLIAGGYDGSIFLSSTELYDPATNSFAVASDTAAMNHARYLATAMFLPSGKVLIAGGCDGSIFLSSTELYDPATNSFATAADTAAMNTARGGATATLLASGKVLIAGGVNTPSGYNAYLSSTELYDPATNSFAAAADTAAMNDARYLATATLLTSGKVLIAGGVGASALSSTELYDPATNSFATAADTAAMNDTRSHATATLLPSGKVLIAGGGGGTVSDFLSSTELYDPATNSFATAADTAAMNTARSDATATLLPSGKVLIAGGVNSHSAYDALPSSTELYDPAINSFAAAGDTAKINTARFLAAAILLPLTPGGSVSVTSSGSATVFAGQRNVAGGTFTVSNTSASAENITAVTVAVSHPSMFSSMTLICTSCGGSPSVTVTPPSASTVFFGSPISVPVEGLATFALTANISLTPAMAEHKVAYAGIIGARDNGNGLGSLAVGLSVLGLGMLAFPAANRRRMWLVLAAVLLLAGTQVGCGSNNRSTLASTQTVTMITATSEGGTVTFGGLPAKLGTLTL